MATAGPSEICSVSDHIEAQNYRSLDAPRQPSSCRAGSPKSLRDLSSGESITRIPSPERSNRRYSSVFSSKPPSRSSSPGSSVASSVKEVNVTDEEVQEPEPDLRKAPEHFSRVFSVPKALFDICETYREWHFSFAPTQNVHALLMQLNEETVRREKAERQVRDLTQLLISGAEPGPKIQPPEQEQKSPEVYKVPASKRLFIKDPDARRKELIENKENRPLQERFDALMDWSEEVEADIGAAQDRNTRFDDMLDKAGKDIRKLKDEKFSTQTEGSKGKGIACQTTMAHDDQSSMILGAGPLQPLASQIVQENRLAELQQENERLRQENDAMRSALEQHQNEDSPPEGPESQVNDGNPEEAQIRSADPGVEVQGGDVEMGGITTGQDSTAPQYIEAPLMPLTPPATSETEVILRFDPQRLLKSINRDSRTSSDNARRRRDSRRRERQIRREQRRTYRVITPLSQPGSESFSLDERGFYCEFNTTNDCAYRSSYCHSAIDSNATSAWSRHPREVMSGNIPNSRV
ncbi:hypothetical protein DER46DRAFT_639581 [Fusarium sp. MPI-SDFR-AT-0072]|nr:hypothetical protein DER46DRAFT_639581 [Fusarium sp. MPI-SDFR-AT-0072]